MKILIKNCTLVSMDEKRPKYDKNMNILIENENIIKIFSNSSKTLLDKDIDKIIDANEDVVMPGLINTHCHLSMSIFRETVDGLGLQDWLTKKIWPIEEKLTSKDIYDGSKISFQEMIETGTTTVNDMYFMAKETIKAAKEMGIRLQTTRALMDLSGKKDGDLRIKEIEELLEKNKNEELITINAGLHGFYTSSEDYAKKVIRFAKNNNLILHTHFCENEKEVEDIKKGYNKTPVEILKHELPGTKAILAHCVKLSNKEIEEISKIHADISIATCPVSNLKLGCGIANISKMQEVGLNISIGTDGQGSGCNLDLFEQMKYVALLQKGMNEKPELMPAYEILKMATINGAKALGLEKKIGSIEVGKRADLIIIDMKSSLTTPVNDLIAELVYNIKGFNVKTTIANGKILMENRKLRVLWKK